MKPQETLISIADLRRRLDDAPGKTRWRSLGEVAQTPEFEGFLHAEFPKKVDGDPVDRRDFMKLLGASMALAGATGCTRQPPEHILPYVRQPEEFIPGKPIYYATAVPFQGVGRGVLVESHLGRPTKIEGNPDHPDSAGRTDAMLQATILGLYDPDRSQTVNFRGRISTFTDFTAQLSLTMASHQADQGRGLRLLTGAVSSPTALSQILELLASYPRAHWHRYEPLSRDAVYEGSRLAFGEAVETQYELEKADVILSLDADFLYGGVGTLKYTRQFAARRSVEAGTDKMNRLYAAECTPTLTGATADHRLALAPQALLAFAAALARALGVDVGSATLKDEALTPWMEAVALDLKAHRGRSVVMAGEHQPAALHALAHALNAKLENVGQTVRYTDPVEGLPTGKMASLRDLSDAIQANQVQTLVILGTNPVYDAPADLGFTQKLDTVPLRIHWGLYNDETAEHCHWHVPAAHCLESWGDVRGCDGSVTVQQPVIEPLYSGTSLIEMLDALGGKGGRPPYEVLQAYWEAKVGGAAFAAFWKRSIHDGIMADSAFPARELRLAWDPACMQAALAGGGAPDSMELVLRPDPSVWDGSLANNGWLQELPKPLTKMTWENAALVSPSLAESLQLLNGEVVKLICGDAQVEGPAWIVPGHPRNSVTVHLGYGRTRAGGLGTGIGFSGYALQASTAPWSRRGLVVQKTGRTATLATTQEHHSMEGRNLVRSGTATQYQADPHFAKDHEHIDPKKISMYPDFPYEGYKWGLTIDLNTCTGCNACTMACQAENNIPIVGKVEVAKGREMHWIRVDRYYEGGLDDPETLHQPVPCMHCERAPCEVVCPVGATVHSTEGLNQMVYNRCVGTKYCSNNCPYKVRRFNFFPYAARNTEQAQAPVLEMQRNPDVTVRMRGVMEKCTYCVQRINAAKITAKNGSRKVQDGEIRTACQQACPVGAITFGDLNDAQSAVKRQADDSRNYALLAELGTRPRTTYLARIRNPNPALAQEQAEPHGH